LNKEEDSLQIGFSSSYQLLLFPTFYAKTSKESSDIGCWFQGLVSLWIHLVEDFGFGMRGHCNTFQTAGEY